MKKYSGHIDLYAEDNTFSSESVQVFSYGEQGEWVEYKLPRTILSLLKPTGDTLSHLKEEREALRTRFRSVSEELASDDFSHLDGRLQAFLTEQAEGMRIYGEALSKRIALLERGTVGLDDVAEEWRLTPFAEDDN